MFYEDVYSIDSRSYVLCFLKFFKFSRPAVKRLPKWGVHFESRSYVLCLMKMSIVLMVRTYALCFMEMSIVLMVGHMYCVL